MQHLASRLESITRGIGIAAAWLTLAMVIVMSFVVVQRYLFDAGSIWIQESISLMHAAVFMLAAGYTLAMNDHVRVDVFYSQLGARGKALVELCGTLFLLLPFCGFLIWASWDFVSVSLDIRETSQEAGGLPFPFPTLVKACIPLGALLLILQGLANLLRALAVLSSRDGD